MIFSYKSLRTDKTWWISSVQPAFRRRLGKGAGSFPPSVTLPPTVSLDIFPDKFLLVFFSLIFVSVGTRIYDHGLWVSILVITIVTCRSCVGTRHLTLASLSTRSLSSPLGLCYKYAFDFVQIQLETTVLVVTMHIYSYSIMGICSVVFCLWYRHTVWGTDMNNFGEFRIAKADGSTMRLRRRNFFGRFFGPLNGV